MLERDGDEWTGGTSLDPESCDVYEAMLQPVEGGGKLEVRGYIGIPLIGRTQIWERVEASPAAPD